MSDSTHTEPGNFVWYELHTTNPSASPAFYQHVVGWSSRPMQGGNGYILFENEQGPVAGASALTERAKSMGAPPHWLGNVQVADVDATVSQVKPLDGRVYVEPVTHPGGGRSAVIADPFGAVLGVFAPVQPMKVRDASKPGGVCWHELMSENPELSLAFYGKLFGWKKRSEFDMGTMGKYLLFGNEERDFGGMFAKAKDEHASAWNYYLQVSDIDAAITQVKEKGGTLCKGPMDIVSGARIAHISDPQDAGFSLHENPKA